MEKGRFACPWLVFCSCLALCINGLYFWPSEDRLRKCEVVRRKSSQKPLCTVWGIYRATREVWIWQRGKVFFLSWAVHLRKRESNLFDRIASILNIFTFFSSSLSTSCIKTCEKSFAEKGGKVLPSIEYFRREFFLHLDEKGEKSFFLLAQKADRQSETFHLAHTDNKLFSKKSLTFNWHAHDEHQLSYEKNFHDIH